MRPATSLALTALATLALAAPAHAQARTQTRARDGSGNGGGPYPVDPTAIPRPSLRAYRVAQEIRVDGRLRVMEGLRNIEDSTIEGSGTVEVIGSSLVDLQIVRGVTLEFKGSVDVRVQYAEDAEFDFSASGESARFTVIGDDQRFLRSTFRFGANSLANPLLFRVKNDDAPAWGFDECSLELHLDSNPPIASSTMFVTMQTDLAVPPDPSELDFVVRTVEPVSSFIAIAPNSTGSWDLFVLGVPTGWHPADLTFDGRIDFFDIAAFIGLFTVQSPWANINGDYVIDFFDVADFIAAYLNG